MSIRRSVTATGYSLPRAEEKAADACTHVCSEESGCITKELNCPHVHDETCGYSEGSPCTFDPADCELCNFQENPAEQTILSWEWIGADNLNEGVLPLPGVSAENPVDLDAVVSMLPTGITGHGGRQRRSGGAGPDLVLRGLPGDGLRR